MKISLIITAGGTSSRYGVKNKLFETVSGKLIIEHTVNAFNGIEDISEIIIPAHFKFIDDLKKCFADNKKIKIVNGGENRQQSVYNALLACSEPDFVIIHDGARPLIEKKIINDCILAATKSNAAIVAARVTDTIKRVNSDFVILGTEPRENLFSAQTPQVFQYNLIKSLHEKYKGHGFTDDALLCEAENIPVRIVEGCKSNIKITYQSDLFFVENYIAAKNPY